VSNRVAPKDQLLDWVDAQVDIDTVSKFILMKLAQYADAHGRAWSKIKTLAAHCNVSDRTVQGRLRSLAATGLIRATGDHHSCDDEGHQRVPFYEIAPGREFRVRESAAARRASKRQAANSAPGANLAPLNGANFTPPVQLPAPPREPRGTYSSEDESARATLEAFDRVFAKWTERGPGSTSYAAAQREWLELAEGWGVARLEAAAMAYLRWSSDARGREPKALQYWLRDLDFKATLPREAEAQGPASAAASALKPGAWPGPPAIRELVVSLEGEAFAVSWLDRCDWDEATSTIIAPLGVVKEKLTQFGLGRKLECAGAVGGVAMREPA
jgi:hypothetical protein